MSENNFAKDLMAALKDQERQKQFDGEARELGEYVLEILDRLRKSTRTMDERKETKIFDRYDVRGDEFLCDITSVCDKTGEEEKAHALAAVIGAYANAVCDTPCFKTIGITPTVFMKRFNIFFADLVCEFGDKFVDNVSKKAG